MNPPFLPRDPPWDAGKALLSMEMPVPPRAVSEQTDLKAFLKT